MAAFEGVVFESDRKNIAFEGEESGDEIEDPCVGSDADGR